MNNQVKVKRSKTVQAIKDHSLNANRKKALRKILDKSKKNHSAVMNCGKAYTKANVYIIKDDQDNLKTRGIHTCKSSICPNCAPKFFRWRWSNISKILNKHAEHHKTVITLQRDTIEGEDFKQALSSVVEGRYHAQLKKDYELIDMIKIKSLFYDNNSKTFQSCLTVVFMSEKQIDVQQIKKRFVKACSKLKVNHDFIDSDGEYLQKLVSVTSEKCDQGENLLSYFDLIDHYIDTKEQEYFDAIHQYIDTMYNRAAVNFSQRASKYIKEHSTKKPASTSDEVTSKNFVHAIDANVVNRFSTSGHDLQTLANEGADLVSLSAIARTDDHYSREEFEVKQEIKDENIKQHLALKEQEDADKPSDEF
jgi:uncharacterized protein (DUF4415 family)